MKRQLICPLEFWRLVVGKEYLLLTKQEKAGEGLTRLEQRPLAHVQRHDWMLPGAVGIG